jgi:hypothetical protein
MFCYRMFDAALVKLTRRQLLRIKERQIIFERVYLSIILENMCVELQTKLFKLETFRWAQLSDFELKTLRVQCITGKERKQKNLE